MTIVLRPSSGCVLECIGSCKQIFLTEKQVKNLNRTLAACAFEMFGVRSLPFLLLRLPLPLHVQFDSLPLVGD